jgi:carbonyl reductase 1
MTKGFGAKLTPEQGCVSSIKCLFDSSVVSGYYYGSDGLRSPLTCTRDPGTPEYGGEPNPDPAIYNK